MYLRKCRKAVSGAEYAYWQLVESHRTERGPRQRVVAYLGDMQEALRLGIAEAANGKNGVRQDTLLPGGAVPEWVEVDDKNMQGTLKNLPERDEILPDINENLVVELYSK